jgi:hypothetical protein
MARSPIIKRPLAAVLILAYVTLSRMVAILFPDAAGVNIGVAIVSGLIGSFIAYKAIWRMQRDWMYLMLAGLCLTALLSLLQIPQNIFTVFDVMILFVSIAWLVINKELFHEGDGAGTKGEWIRVGLIVVGALGIPLLAIYFTPDLLLYAAVLIPLWIAFVWFVLPRFIRLLR